MTLIKEFVNKSCSSPAFYINQSINILSCAHIAGEKHF